MQLSLNDSAELLSASQHLVQTTSLFRYRVFVNDNDYRKNPNMTKHPMLRKYVLEDFAAEVEDLKDALFIGPGPHVYNRFHCLIQERVLESNRVVGGMLHPSGNCTYRIKHLISDRSAPIPHPTNPAPYDNGRRAFQEQFLGIRS
jgi:hypothetical protein